MMRSTITIARRDLRALFDHPTGYIMLVVFLVVTEFLFFNTGQVLVIGVATLRPMLDLLPWIMLFFVPAVTMRALAEETRAGTLEVVLAQPVTEMDVLAGKYLGHLMFVWIGLALTIPISIGLALGVDQHVGVVLAGYMAAVLAAGIARAALGRVAVIRRHVGPARYAWIVLGMVAVVLTALALSPALPVGVLVAQYVGAALLAAALVGVGIWASSVTANQITAFILGIAVMFALILAGAGPLVTGLPVGLANIAGSLSVLPHFSNITRGVIDLRDAVYFLTLAAVFLGLAYLSLTGGRLSRAGATLQRLRMGMLLFVAIMVVVNLFGRHIGGRLDLTPGKAYTLSRASRDLLRDLDDLVTITFYVSKGLPTQVTLLERDIRDVLADMKSAGGGQVRVQVADPADDEDVENEARAIGVTPVQFNVVGEGELQVKEGYLGLSVQYADGVEVIPFVQQTEDLEYQLISFVHALTRTTKDIVGLISASAGMTGQPGPSYNRLREALSQQYDVRMLSVPSDSERVPEEIDVLVLGGSPAFLTDSQAQAFDAFFDRGGGALVMASGMVPQQQGFMASPQPVGYNRILGRFGVSINPDMVYDLLSNELVTLPVTGGRVSMSYPFWVRALSTRQVAMNRGVESVMLQWTSSVAVNDSVRGVVTPLFVTSEASRAESGTAFIHPQRDYPQDSLGTIVLAVAVNPLASDSTSGIMGRAVVVGNKDLASDRNSDRAGLVFALNAVDWLAQDDALVAIRSKSRRPPSMAFESDLLRDLVKWGNVVGVPILLVLFGTVRMLRRGRQAGRTYEPGAAA